MPLFESREYRDRLYRSRSHPDTSQEDFSDNRDSFVTVYASLIPFIGAEYLAQLTYELIPSGLVFPVGWILFWAFFYTYYKPNVLEDKLSSTESLNPAAIFSVVIGVIIWFIKVTLVELVDLLFLRWFRPRPQPVSVRRSSPVGLASASSVGVVRTSVRRKLPAELVKALRVLGLNDTADWPLIHRRFRELAKKYHPDLHGDVTDGHHFIAYQSAYRTLEGARAKFFSEKTKS